MLNALWIPVPLLVVAAVIDSRTRLVSDIFPLALVACAVAFNLLEWTTIGWVGSGLGLAAAFGLGLLLHRTTQLGGGDVGLLAGIGAILGPVAFGACFVVIASVGGVLALRARRAGGREYAYAPAIAVGYVGFVLAVSLHRHLTG